MDKKIVDLIYKDEVYQIVGAAMEVYNELGCGFLEAVYQEGMEIELEMRKIEFDSQRVLKIVYKEVQLKKEYVPDIICYNKIIVELKAIETITGNEEAQIINYLKATGMKVGILINFGRYDGLQWKRFVY